MIEKIRSQSRIPLAIMYDADERLELSSCPSCLCPRGVISFLKRRGRPVPTFLATTTATWRNHVHIFKFIAVVLWLMYLIET